MKASETFPAPVSVYGATKLAQEHILQAWAKSYGVETVILRLQNVYGPGQSLINPYTGIMSLFCRMAMGGKSIPLYEDGEVRRDFILIDDVASAIVAGAVSPTVQGEPMDIGSGEFQTIGTAAKLIAAALQRPRAPRHRTVPAGRRPARVGGHLGREGGARAGPRSTTSPRASTGSPTGSTPSPTSSLPDPDGRRQCLRLPPSFRCSIPTTACWRTPLRCSAQVDSVVVVDDGSPEDPARILAALEAMGCKVERLTENSGIAAALNAGITAALAADTKPDYILTMDQDSLLDPGYVDALLAAAAAAGEAGVPVGMVAPASVRGLPVRRGPVLNGIQLGGEPIQSGLLVPVPVLERLGPLPGHAVH